MVPYEREYADKSSHYDLIKNPDVGGFLDECSYLQEPSEQQTEAICSPFWELPREDECGTIKSIIAIDGSYYESAVDDRFPSTRIAYMKIGSVYVDMRDWQSLRVMDDRYVDPFRVAKLLDSKGALALILPSSNVVYRGKQSVRDSFRYALHQQLSAMRPVEDEERYSIRSVLAEMASLRDDQAEIRLHKCPRCLVEYENGIRLDPIHGTGKCAGCDTDLFVSDALRVWEDVSEYHANTEPLTRLMVAIEHLTMVNYISYIRDHDLDTLSSTAFFVDGPLAIFGNPAWLHASIMKFLASVNRRLIDAGRRPLLIIGLQKTGQVVDFARAICRYIPNGSIMPITDDYRYTYILSGREPAAKGFGSETYYGQDFIYKTPSGRVFVLALPYPFADKSPVDGVTFACAKVDMARYQRLGTAAALIRHFESDLYTNAVVPVALAHKHTAISLVPGGKVLDQLTKQRFQKPSTGNGSVAGAPDETRP